MFPWSVCFFILNNHNFKPSSLSSNLYFQRFLFTALITTHTDLLVGLRRNNALANQTRALWGQTWHRFCPSQSPFGGLPQSKCFNIHLNIYCLMRRVAAFKPWPLRYVPLPNAVSLVGGLKQPCPNSCVKTSCVDGGCNQSLWASWLIGEEKLEYILQWLQSL